MGKKMPEEDKERTRAWWLLGGYHSPQPPPHKNSRSEESSESNMRRCPRSLGPSSSAVKEKLVDEEEID